MAKKKKPVDLTAEEAMQIAERFDSSKGRGREIVGMITNQADSVQFLKWLADRYDSQKRPGGEKEE